MGILACVCGLIAYAVFLACDVYAVAFVGDLGVPRSVSVGSGAQLGTALVIDLALLTLFAVQHGVMARPR